MSKVFITDRITDPSYEKEILGNQLTLEPHGDIEVLLVWHETIDSKYIDRFPKLKAIIRYGVGYDRVDCDYARSRGISVSNNPDYCSEEVADTALAMILGATRGVFRYDAACRHFAQGWQENTNPSLRRTNQLTLGVVGAGRIGSSVLLRAEALGFKTVFHDPYKQEGYAKVLKSRQVHTLSQLLEMSQVVSLHVPLTTETQGMVDEGFIERMQAGAVLVNTARGKLIRDVDILLPHLKSGHLSCVALDVLPEEPPSNSALIEAWRTRERWLDGRLILNPHAAFFSQDSQVEMRTQVARNALRIIRGEQPLFVVNGLR